MNQISTADVKFEDLMTLPGEVFARIMKFVPESDLWHYAFSDDRYFTKLVQSGSLRPAFLKIDDGALISEYGVSSKEGSIGESLVRSYVFGKKDRPIVANSLVNTCTPNGLFWGPWYMFAEPDTWEWVSLKDNKYPKNAAVFHGGNGYCFHVLKFPEGKSGGQKEVMGISVDQGPAYLENDEIKIFCSFLVNEEGALSSSTVIIGDRRRHFSNFF